MKSVVTYGDTLKVITAKEFDSLELIIEEELLFTREDHCKMSVIHLRLLQQKACDHLVMITDPGWLYS